MAPLWHVSVSCDGASRQGSGRLSFMPLNKALHLTVSKVFPQGS